MVKTSKAMRFLSLLMTMLMVMSLFTSALAVDTPATEPEESEPAAAPEAAEEVSYEMSPVVEAFLANRANAMDGNWLPSEYDQCIMVESDEDIPAQPAPSKLLKGGATVMSAPAGKSCYLYEPGYPNPYTIHYGRTNPATGQGYGMTNVYQVDLGDEAQKVICTCGNPSKSGPAPGDVSNRVELLDASDPNYLVLKATFATSPFGAYRQSFWDGVCTDDGNINAFAYLHAIVGHLYEGGTRNWNGSYMEPIILGSGGLLENIINYANTHANELSKVNLYRINYGASSGGAYQDLLFATYPTPAAASLRIAKKVAEADREIVRNNPEKYSVIGTQFQVYYDQSCTRPVSGGALTVGADWYTTSVELPEEGTYWVREESATSGFERQTAPVSAYCKAGETTWIEFENHVQKCSLSIVKESANEGVSSGNCNYTLAGAEFAVYSDAAHTKLVGKLTTDANGKTGTLNNLTPGTYYIVETKAPDGFEINESISPVEVNEQNTVKEIDENPISDPVFVMIQKVDKLTGEPKPAGDFSLAGAQYTFKYYDVIMDNADADPAEAGHQPLRTWVYKTDKAGRIDFSNENLFVSGDELYYDLGIPCIPLGTVTIQETQAPDHYDIDQEIHVAQVTPDGVKPNQSVKENAHGDLVVESAEAPDTAKLRIIKHLNLAKSGQEQPEPGAEFHVYLASAGSFDAAEDYQKDTLVTNEDGEAISKDLPLGVYVVEQVSGKEGYYKVDSFNMDLTIKQDGSPVTESGYVKTVILNDAPVEAYIQVTKIDSITGEAIPWKGVGFQIFNKNDELQKSSWGEDTFYSDNTGIVRFPEKLPYGEYYVKEVEGTQPKGYVFGGERVEFSVKEDRIVFETPDGAAEPIPTVKLYYANQPTEVDVVKVDPYGMEVANAVEGAKLQLINAAGEVVEEWTSSKDAHVILRLPAGETYTIHEAEVPAGYLPADDVTFTVEGLKEAQLVAMIDELIPKIGTTATVDGEHVAKPEGSIELVDTVAYKDLVPGKEYKLVATLMDKATGEPVVDANGNAFVVRQGFTASDRNGSVDVVFKIEDASILEGTTTVVFETLIKNGKEIAIHADINDEDQTVYWPEIHTTATADDDHVAKAEGTKVIRDEVQYTNLKVGENYVVTGTLMDKADGKPILDADGNEIVVTKEFTASTSDGSVVIEFEVDASLLEGKTTVAFESVNHGKKEVAVHADINDEDQTVYWPEIHTTAVVDDLHIALAEGEVTFTDTVAYKSLKPGHEYVVNGVLMDKATGEALKDADGNDIVASTTFTPEEPDGAINVVFTVDASMLEGKTTVVFESIEKEGKEIAIHADINDEDQTIYWPEIHTTATADDDHVAKAEGTKKIVDVVEYKALKPGVEYTVTGTLMDKETEEPILDKDGNPITASTTFTPDEPDGSVEVVFEVDAALLKGKTTVAFETITTSDRPVAVHADINDVPQTVYWPEIKTTATVNDSHDVLKDAEVTLVDVVSYKSLLPGQEYTVKGILMDKATGEPFLDKDGKEITAEATFTPEEPDGKIEMEFKFDTSVITKETNIVVFESLYKEDVELAVHADIEDADQTVTVHVPEIKTHASVGGKQDVTASKTVKIEDFVSYKNLIVGKEYVIRGILMDKATGEPFHDKDGKEITSEVKFTPEKSDGEVTVVFEFDGTLIKKDTILVVFEDLLRDEVQLTSHADLEDAEQTVVIHKIPETPKTGDTRNPFLWAAIAVLALAGIAGCAYVMRRNATKKEN